VAALTKHAHASRARHALQVGTELAEEPALPLDTKEALYRIAQEALHNIVKHAEATRVDLSLTCRGAEVVLEVRDNGRGFDPAGDFPGHLGLKSMRERALRAGGLLSVRSSPGAGTTVRAVVPLPSEPGR
jgi:signal transduction histidine kinase